MSADLRKLWDTGLPVEDDRYYYRNDEELVNRCIESQVGVVRVLGARRFGKTSFLKRLERWAKRGTSDAGVKYKWLEDEVHLVEFQDDEGATTYLNELNSARKRDDGTAKPVLLLIDEFNKVLSEDQTDLCASLKPLLLRAFKKDSKDPVRVVIAEATNLNDKLNDPKCRLNRGLADQLMNDAAIHYMYSLNATECDSLLTHRKAHEPPQVDQALLDYANNHPLFLQYVCEAYFRDKISSLEQFQKVYLERSGSPENPKSIYENLSKNEKLVLRYLYHYPEVTSNHFKDPAGWSTLSRLQKFGLVQVQEDLYSIKSKVIRDYMSNRDEGVNAPDGDGTVADEWPDLIKKPHKSVTWQRKSCIIHHLGNLHLRTSRFASKKQRANDGDGLGPTWQAYLKFVREAREKGSAPNILVVAGDLVLSDMPTGDSSQNNAADRAYKLVRKELNEIMKSMRKPDDNDSKIIVVPGDTDVLLKRGDDDEEHPDTNLVQDFECFETVFEEWDKWRCFNDIQITLVPMNSACIPDSVLTKSLASTKDSPLESLNRFIEHLAQTPHEQLHRLYKEHQENDFGCLEENAESLKADLANEVRRQKTEKPEEWGSFDRSLRIAVFHHHFEQLAKSPAVDFWASHDMKKALAKERFSIVLNGQSLHPFMHSDTIYDDIPDGWRFHSIGCGSMNKEFIEGADYRPSFNKISVQVDLRSAENCKYRYTIMVTEVRLDGDVFHEIESSTHTFVVDR